MDFLGQQATLLDFEQRIEMTACIVGCCRKMRLCSSRVVIDALAHVTLYFAQFLPLVTPLPAPFSLNPFFSTKNYINRKSVTISLLTQPSKNLPGNPATLPLPSGSRSLQQSARTHRERTQRTIETRQMGHVSS